MYTGAYLVNSIIPVLISEVLQLSLSQLETTGMSLPPQVAYNFFS